MLYDASLSVEENAERCEVSVPTINLWLRTNNVDRLYDSMLLRFKAVKKIQKQHPDWSVRKIVEETKYSINTVRKYLAMEEFEKPKEKDKVSTIDTSCSKFIIKSINDNQQEILNNIIKLYLKKDAHSSGFHILKGWDVYR